MVSQQDNNFPDVNNTALLVHISRDGVALNDKDELIGLAISVGAKVLAVVDANVRNPDPGLFIGRGKADELQQLVALHQPELVIVSSELTASQERNLEKHCKCRVIDRTRLILDIFALRARTHEGKLQVELAQLAYLSTRLIRGWTHLERQRGGIGLRGPGETQLESDRRMLDARVAQLKKQLKIVTKRRQLGRNSRNSCVVALAGYTNAGKTSLFNVLCADNQYVADQLFASLDIKLRRVSLPGTHQAVLIDTVGFIENLPHQLVEAFSSTLEEVVHADIILHICDASDDRREEKIQAVHTVLDEIGASAIPKLMVWNKCDLLDDEQTRLLPLRMNFRSSMQSGDDLPEEWDTDGIAIAPVSQSADVHQYQHQDQVEPTQAVAVSVHTGYGIDSLREAIAHKLAPQRKTGWYVMDDRHASKNRAWLYKHHAVKQEVRTNEGNLCLLIDADAAIVQHLEGMANISAP